MSSSPEPVDCPEHRGYWRQGCSGCQSARLRTLASVQSGTVHAADQDIHLRVAAWPLLGRVWCPPPRIAPDARVGTSTPARDSV